jgi:glucokinase
MSNVTAIGVDIGGTNIRAARISLSGEILEWATHPTASQPSLVSAQIADLARSLDDESVKTIGIGIPGRVDARLGRVLSGGYVDLANISLASVLRDAFDRPIFIDNDCSMALVAEHAIGRARDVANVVMFTIGTGIGGAVIMNGTVVRGRAAAGQLGHITVDPGGEHCLCGRRGCVETTSSGRALSRHLAAVGFDATTSIKNLLARSSDGDALATSVLAAWAAPMRIAIDTAVAAFDPDLVILGGGLGIAMHQALANFPALAPWYQSPVRPAELGDRAGVIGAGLSALTQLEENP